MDTLAEKKLAIDLTVRYAKEKKNEIQEWIDYFDSKSNFGLWYDAKIPEEKKNIFYWLALFRKTNKEEATQIMEEYRNIFSEICDIDYMKNDNDFSSTKVALSKIEKLFQKITEMENEAGKMLKTSSSSTVYKLSKDFKNSSAQLTKRLEKIQLYVSRQQVEDLQNKWKKAVDTLEESKQQTEESKEQVNTLLQQNKQIMRKFKDSLQENEETRRDNEVIIRENEENKKQIQNLQKQNELMMENFKKAVKENDERLRSYEEKALEMQNLIYIMNNLMTRSNLGIEQGARIPELPFNSERELDVTDAVTQSSQTANVQDSNLNQQRESITDADVETNALLMLRNSLRSSLSSSDTTNNSNSARFDSNIDFPAGVLNTRSSSFVGLTDSDEDDIEIISRSQCQ